MTVKKYIFRLAWFPILFILIYTLISSVILFTSYNSGEQHLFILFGFPIGAILILYFEVPKIVRGVKLCIERKNEPIKGIMEIEKLIEPWFDRRGLKVTAYIKLEGKLYYFDDDENTSIIFDLNVGDSIQISYYPDSKVIISIEKLSSIKW